MKLKVKDNLDGNIWLAKSYDIDNKAIMKLIRKAL